MTLGCEGCGKEEKTKESGQREAKIRNGAKARSSDKVRRACGTFQQQYKEKLNQSLTSVTAATLPIIRIVAVAAAALHVAGAVLRRAAALEQHRRARVGGAGLELRDGGRRSVDGRALDALERRRGRLGGRDGAGGDQGQEEGDGAGEEKAHVGWMEARTGGVRLGFGSPRCLSLVGGCPMSARE